ncbi:MAG: type III-B CRISPR-associated protein Cas10/Cmr2 [Thermoproteota archaeon]
MKTGWCEDFFWWKIGALTHDPPHKAWIITGKCGWKDGLTDKGVDAAEKEVMSADAHERTAFAIRTNVFIEELAKMFLKEPWKDIIGKSDRLASSFDRWQISEIYELRDELNIRDFHPFNVEKVYLFNTLSGDLIKPEIPDHIDLTKFEDRLKNLWKEISELDLSLRYNVFYALYEPLFYENAFGASGPADTRTPSHTLFDHLYASAAVVNWLCPEGLIGKGEIKPRGLLVRIDFGGIQDFISASKKLRDVWFSSWLTSALAFKTVEELIEKIGADILIRPTARHNPFYYNFLIRKLEEKRASEKVRVELEEIAERYAGLGEREERKDWPRYAIIPATIDLILPPYDILSKLTGRDDMHDEEQLTSYFYERYAKCWADLVKITIKDGIEKLERGGELTEKLKEKLEEAQKEIDQYGTFEAPPLIMRIVIVSVPEDLKEDKKTQELQYYDNAFQKLNEKFQRTKALKIHPACQTKLTQVTEEAWKSRKRYRVCTTCGKFPSVLDIPNMEEEYGQIVPFEFRVYLDLGEHLCPYCLVKRLATHRAIFSSVAKELIGYAVSPPSFPSTSSIAAYPFMEGLVEARDDHEVGKIVNAIMKEAPPYRILPYWDALRELLNRAKKSAIENFLYCEPEEALLSEERETQIRVRNLQEAVERAVHDILDPIFTNINTYYAIVRADGDYVGHLFAGYLNRETIGTDYVELISSAIENIRDPKAKRFARLIRESANNDRLVVERMLYHEFNHMIKEDAKDRISCYAKRLCSLFSEVVKNGKIPVTPAYHAMLSRALMITALRDIEEAHREAKGMVVYASGDDLLAFVPIAFSLNLVHKTRKCYSVGDPEHRGFHRMGSGYFASLGRASRTYSVIFGHFKYPMSRLLGLSLEYLDEAKNSLTVYGVVKKAKDALLLAYCPRGGGIKIKSILPLSTERPIMLLMSLIEYIENRLLSHSVIYDLTKYSEVYLKEAQRLRAFDTLESMFRYIIDRNIIPKEAPIAELISSEFKELAGYVLSLNGEDNPLSSQITLALWATIAALRGREL